MPPSNYNFSKIIVLHSLETVAKLSNQKTMISSFSCAAVSRAPRQQLNRDSCKSPNTQWKMPSEEKGGREEEEKEEEWREKAEKNTCHQLELYVLTHHPHHTHINVGWYGKFNIGI